MKYKKIIIIVLIVLLIEAGFYVYKKQAPTYEQFKIETEYRGTTAVKIWLESYLDAHIEKLNFKDALSDYEIIGIEDVYQVEEPTETWPTYQVRISGKSKKTPETLFKTKPLFEEGKYHYDLVLTLKFEGNILMYANDLPHDKYMEDQNKQARPDLIDPIEALYRKNNMGLEIRESIDSSWLKTPVSIDSFSGESKGWYRNDRRIVFKDNDIGILHFKDDEGYAVTHSHDAGKTWETNVIIDREDLMAVNFAYIGYEDNEFIVAVSSNVALNSEIMTYYRGLNKGKTWTGGKVPYSSGKPYEVSYLGSGRIFVTYINDPTLYYTDDLGITFNEITIPQHQLNKKDKPYLDNLEWNDFFIQASAPYIEDGTHYMLMSQGENGDYDKNTNARYISKDKGMTWKFEDFEARKVKEELN